ncbi:MAG: NAD(P)-dependent oxidoreductase [Planctomycetes bacterium]|nr:NAD(P)-dependent oxidoreductase [Planctomycetota bacterium]
MNILVTGGGGFVGRHVVSQLLQQGHTVINYSRDVFPVDDARNIMVYGELYDIPRLASVIRDHGVERVINAAGQSHPPTSLLVPLATMEANVMGTTYVLEAARMTGVRRVVLYSSEAVYGNVDAAPAPMGLDTPLRPLTPYGVSKAAIEMLGRAYNLSFGMDTVSIRLGEVYGPGRVSSETVMMAADAAVEDRPLVLERGRDQRLHLIHVDDAARVSVLACLAQRINSAAVYHATSGGHPTFGEVIDIVKAMLPGARIEVGPGDLGYERHAELDMTETRRDLGYTPGVTLEAGVRSYVNWLLEKKGR